MWAEWLVESLPGFYDINIYIIVADQNTKCVVDSTHVHHVHHVIHY